MSLRNGEEGGAPEQRTASPRERGVAAVRRFSRFYTRRLGVLREGLLQSPFSLTEARVLYELANRDCPTATEVGRDLKLDPGYLSRILRRFRKERLVESERSARDGRQSLLALTARGRSTFARLDAASRSEVGQLLARLSGDERQQVVAAMATIEGLLGEQRQDAKPLLEEKTVAPPQIGLGEPFLLRPHQPGDLGWVVERHGALYAQEYGWDSGFEALVARIAAEFLETFDPTRERCWIAERAGARLGCVFLVRKSKAVAKLRLLLVEPKARGLGLGRRLVDECTRFARQAGYRKITLWTNDPLKAARHLYQAAGYRLVEAQPTRAFGQAMVSETWELTL